MIDSPTTQSTGDSKEPVQDYWDWYNEPDNRIRKSNEAMGVRARRSPSGMTVFYMDIEDFRRMNSQQVNTYPEYFQNRTMDRFVTEIYSAGENRELARKAKVKTGRYIENLETIIDEYGGAGLYYYSKQRGSGKTFLSTILGSELTKKGFRVRWYSMMNLIQEIKAGFDRESVMSSAAVIDRARGAQVLILDDIGVEKQSAWLNETVYSILDYRLTHRMPTIFTSNRKPEELGYDERIVDRISRMSERIAMPEENIRMRLNARSRLGAFLEGKT